MTNYEKALDADHPSVIASANNLAAALTAQGKDQEAERLLRRVVATRRKLFGEEHPAVANALDMLTHVLFKLQRFDEAEVTAREDFAVARKLSGDTSERALEAFRDLIDALLSQHKFEEAERLFADVLPPELELQSKYANLLFERCNTYARCGRWRKAAEDAAILLKHSPDNHECYHTLAPLQVRLGDLVEYQELSRTILDKFSRTTDIYIADRMAKDCLILPSSGVDLKTVAAMADLAASGGSKEDVAPYFHFCKGLAEFRLGHYDEAIRWARLATKGPFPQPKACAAAVLAMSQFKLDQSDDARTALSECNKIIEGQMPKPERELGRAWRGLDYRLRIAIRSTTDD